LLSFIEISAKTRNYANLMKISPEIHTAFFIFKVVSAIDENKVFFWP